MDRGHDPGIQGFSYRAKDAPFPSCTNFLQPVRCDQAEMQGSQPVPTSSPPKGATKLKYRVPGERTTTQQARLMSWVHVPTEQAREHCVRVPSPPLGVHCPLSWYSARRSRPLPGSKAGQRASLGSSGTKGRQRRATQDRFLPSVDLAPASVQASGLSTGRGRRNGLYLPGGISRSMMGRAGGIKVSY